MSWHSSIESAVYSHSCGRSSIGVEKRSTVAVKGFDHLYSEEFACSRGIHPIILHMAINNVTSLPDPFSGLLLEEVHNLIFYKRANEEPSLRNFWV
jgi:hypothetical protein